MPVWRGPPTAPTPAMLDQRPLGVRLASMAVKPGPERPEAHYMVAEPGVSANVGIPNNVEPAGGWYPIPLLLDLSHEERAVEAAFIRMYQSAPAELVARFLEKVLDPTKQIYETDMAKELFPGWMKEADFKALPTEEKDKVRAFRAMANRALHQVAHAVVKQAFLARLDAIRNDPLAQVVVTVGGCTAGKGCLGAIADQDPKLKSVLERVAAHGATFDAAGEQFATDNPWILRECQKREIPVTFVYVHNDVINQIEDNFQRAVLIGRAVEGRDFVGSYLDGASNMTNFMETPDMKQAMEEGQAHVVVIDNSASTFENGKDVIRARQIEHVPLPTVSRRRALRAFTQHAQELIKSGALNPVVGHRALRGLPTYRVEFGHAT